MTEREVPKPRYRYIREGGEPADEAKHFYVCKACGQAVDMRDLGAVIHHEVAGHKPLPTT